MRKILETIGSHEPHGRHVLEIADDIRIHRDTVRRLCEKLENDHYIRRSNKQSAFHLTDKIYGDPIHTAFLFQGQAIRNIRNWKWLSHENKFCNVKYCKQVYKDINKSSFKDLTDQLTLFEFANRVGALIIYSMIQACRPKSPEIDMKLIDIDLKGDKKDKAAIAWIDSINGSQIFAEFSKMDLVRKGLSRYNSIPFNRQEIKKEVLQEFINSLKDDDRKQLKEFLRVEKLSKEQHNDNTLYIYKLDMNYFSNLIEVIKTKYSDFYQQLEKWLDTLHEEHEFMKKRQFDPYNPLWSYYEMHDDDFRRLVNAYASVYPDIYKDLEKIRKAMTSKIESLREYVRSRSH